MDLEEAVESFEIIAGKLLDPSDSYPGALRVLKDDLQHADEPLALDEKDARDEAFDLADTDLLIRRVKSAASDVHKLADELQRVIEARLPALLAQAEMPRVDRKGSAFHPTTKLYVKPVAGYDNPALIEFLQRHERGELVKTAVNNQALRSALIEMRDEAGGELPEAIIEELEGIAEVSYQASVSVRKA